MIEEMRRRGASASIGQLEAGWVLEDNIAMRRPIEMFGGQIDKIHRIYEKRLPGAATQPTVMNGISVTAHAAPTARMSSGAG